VSEENSQNGQNVKRIHLLDKKVSELIAAGEVVERPASAVKELLENAIDAGATAITLEIKNGGVSFIRLTDNGGGILREDAPTAFLRHATSKVSTQDDLAAIGTLGFRGEALASIAAVSKTELITRTAEELAGTHLSLEGGDIIESGDAGCPQGTTIIVRELFYNTPARMKFLKKDTTEGSAVTAVAQRIALSHPEVSLRFIKDGREELHTPGDNKLISAVHSVLGREFASSLIEVGYTLAHINVTGYISKPLAARPNRNMQFFFLNGRLVKSKTMMAALEEAYKNNIMVGKYPGCVLHLEVNPALADVNVHPAKLEVRFANEHEIFEAVYYATKNSLTKDDERPTFDIKGNKVEAGSPQTGAKSVSERGGNLPQTFTKMKLDTSLTRDDDFIADDIKNKDKNENEEQQMRLIMNSTPLQPEREETQAVYNTVRSVYEPVSHGTFNSVNIDIEVEPDDSAENKKLSASYRKKEPEDPTEISDADGVIVLGQCFGTYIMAQKGDSLWIIDKHAAHERILYEKVKKQRRASSQVLLEPVTVTLPAEEYAAAVENIELLEQAGITVEDFGGSTLLVREAPLELSGQDIPALVSETAGLLLAHKKDITPARLDWIFHSVACRAAIKAHDRTTLPEMQSLAEIVLCSNDILYCPHGRPVAFELPRRDIEKKFGR
jgi:DNA mismatch repair protein MutL